MRFHSGSTPERRIRSTAKQFQLTSHDGSLSRLQGFKDMIEVNDRCLIVEDNFFIFMAIEDIVMSFGFKQVDRASTLAEAKEHLKNNRYRLALLDFRLGVLNSLPLIEMLEKSKIPFAVTTGYTVDDDMVRAIKGAPVITKPYMNEKVNRVIAELLRAQPTAY
jgi:DNA-binding response OmpR family regulator